MLLPDPFDDDDEQEIDGDVDEVDSEDDIAIACPACGREIYEDAPQCPYCGEYVVSQPATWKSRPQWFIILGVLGIVAVIVALLRIG